MTCICHLLEFASLRFIRRSGVHLPLPGAFSLLGRQS